MTKRNSIKFEYNGESDAAYLKIRPGKVVESEEVKPGLIVDLDEDEQIIGVEILRLRDDLRDRRKSWLGDLAAKVSNCCRSVRKSGQEQADKRSIPSWRWLSF